MDKYQIVKRLEYCVENKCDICQEENGSGFPWIDGRCYGFTERLYDALALLKAQEPVVHGQWITNKYSETVCSECDNNALQVLTGCLVNRHFEPHKSKFCPNCGAKMDKEK